MCGNVTARKTLFIYVPNKTRSTVKYTTPISIKKQCILAPFFAAGFFKCVDDDFLCLK